MSRRVAIVGGGVAGLQTARALRKYGFTPVVFERASSVGGVWRQNYDGFGIQVPRMLYEFPDMKAPYGDYASGAEVQEYIQAYAKRHNLLDPSVLRLNTSVETIRRDEDDASTAAAAAGGWSVSTTSESGKKKTTEKFDAVVIASGLYQKPNMPSFPGKFDGALLHSTEFTNAKETCSGKDVVVIGAGKSAVDCAIAAHSPGGAKSVQLLSRAAHWGTPRMLAGLIPFHWVFLSRLGQALVSFDKGAWPTAPSAVHSAHRALSFVIQPVFRIVEALFALQLGQTGPFRPSKDVVTDFYGGAQVLDSSLKKLVSAKHVRLVKGEVERAEGKTLVLKGGDRVNADVVVMATGFKRDYSKLFDANTLARLDLEEDGLWLYRCVLPTRVDKLAFVGCEVATISNIGTYGLQAEWLSRLWAGKMKAVPSTQVMQEEVDAHKAFSRRWMPTSYARSGLVLLHQTHYHDQLCKDMGVPWRRKGGNILAELFAPYGPADYASVVA